MLDFIEKITVALNRAGDTLMHTSVGKRITAGVIAFSVVLMPISPALIVSAEENQESETAIEETSVSEVPAETEGTEVVDTALPKETAVTDYSEYAIEEPVITESEDVEVVITSLLFTPPTPTKATDAISNTSLVRRLGIIYIS